MKRTAPTPEHAFCTDCKRTKRRTQLSLHPPFINQNPWQTHSGKITFITIIKHVHRCSQERNLHDSILDLIWSYRILVAQNLKGERHGKARNLHKIFKISKRVVTELCVSICEHKKTMEDLYYSNASLCESPILPGESRRVLCELYKSFKAKPKRVLEKNPTEAQKDLVESCT